MRPFEVSIDFDVRTYDVDFAGVVSNITFVRWLEDLRLLMLETHYPLKKLMTEGLAPAVSRTDIRYRHPARLFDRPKGTMWISRIGLMKWVLSASFATGSVVNCEATQTGVFVELDGWKPARIPRPMAEIYESVASDPFPGRKDDR